MQSLLPGLINDSCTIMCWQSHHKDTFFFFPDMKHCWKMQPNQIWPLDNMCHHHCTVNGDWLVTSCEKKLWFCVVLSKPPPLPPTTLQWKKEKENWIVSKPLPSVVQLNNKQNKISQNKCILILKTTLSLQVSICVWS